MNFPTFLTHHKARRRRWVEWKLYSYLIRVFIYIKQSVACAIIPFKQKRDLFRVVKNLHLYAPDRCSVHLRGNYVLWVELDIHEPRLLPHGRMYILHRDFIRVHCNYFPILSMNFLPMQEKEKNPSCGYKSQAPN